MNFKKLLSLVLPLLIFSLISCSNDDDNNTPSTGENIAVLPYQVPTTYEFSRNAITTVDYADQVSRLLMLTEIQSYIGTGKDNPLNSNKLTDMYANANAQFTTTALVGVSSSINLKDKTAASIELFDGGNSETYLVQNGFQGAFDDAVAASQPGAVAGAGVAGKNGSRLYAANGVEPAQLISKGLMGTQFLDQILNNFLSKEVLDASNNRLDNANKVCVSGKNYTAMENAWDQAYGYVYGADSGTSLKFWSSYINQVSVQTATFNSLTTTIKNAFIKGRAAITGNDYAERDRQINIIKENLSKIPAIRAVHYLQSGKKSLGSGIAAFHELSESIGFIMSLRYTNNPATGQPYFTRDEVEVMVTKMRTGTPSQPGLWDVDHLGAKLDAISNQIADKFGFTVADASQG